MNLYLNAFLVSPIPYLFINLSNRAIYPITTRKKIMTGAGNCNFMFVTSNDIAELWKPYYAYMTSTLLFYSELFNYAVFSLFKEEGGNGVIPESIGEICQDNGVGIFQR